MDLPKVSERLGHSSVYVTATVYAHVLKDKDERETVRKWEESAEGQGRCAPSRREAGLNSASILVLARVGAVGDK